MKNKPHFPSLITGLILLLVRIADCELFDDRRPYYLYQRTSYLETPITHGGWWANPALVYGFQKPTLFSSNVTPLGDIFTIATVRFLSPLLDRFTIGAGLLGAGTYRSQSSTTDVGQSGLQFSGNFVFARPTLQLGGACQLPATGKAGILLFTGAENSPYSTDPDLSFFTVGIGCGLISPRLFSRLEFSLSTMSVLHTINENSWDNDGKAAIIFTTPDSLVKVFAECTFSLGTDFGVWFSHPTRSVPYQVARFGARFSVFETIGLLAGISSDRKKFSIQRVYYENATTLHCGLELKKTPDFPFFGGYEAGLSFSHASHFISRFWMGYWFGNDEQ